MKIVALHTDFRIYWPARLMALKEFLYQKGHILEVIEIAGKGSHYAFIDTENVSNNKWHILFPESSPEELSGSMIKDRLFRKLNQINPDVIVAGAIAFPSGALAVAWGQKYKRRVIVFDDAKLDAVQRNLFVNSIKKAVYSGVDAMLYPAKNWIPTGRFWGFKDEQMFFGIDVVDNNFWKLSRDTTLVDGNFFVAVGRQIPQKNFITLVMAYYKYSQQLGDKAYNLVLIGDGPEHQEIVDYIAKYNLENSVKLLPFIGQEDLAGIYQKSRALILCSKVETWGLVINEAMASSCPIIASVECGATNVLVQDGVNGYAFSCDNIESLIANMIKLQQLSDGEQQTMHNASLRIISEWGLDCFCKGCYDAIIYAFNHPRAKVSLLSKMIINVWKGRYRPI